MDDLISRKLAMNEVQRFAGYLDEDMINRIKIALKNCRPHSPKSSGARTVNTDRTAQGQIMILNFQMIDVHANVRITGIRGNPTIIGSVEMAKGEIDDR